MATARSERRARPAAVGALVALAAAGCGAASQAPAARAPAGAFAAVRAAVAPSGWPSVRIPSGAILPYPPGWRRIAGDRGSASAVLLGRGGRIIGYLNATPRSGTETLSNWPRFRPAHNAAEGDRHVRRLEAATGLRLRSGAASCVRDTYSTTTRARYEEIACIVRGPHATAVVVGAAPPGLWRATAPAIERSIAGFRA